MINKNDIFTVEITDQDELGQGIGKVEGFPLFIRHAVMGDVAKVCVTKVKKTYGYGRILEFIKKSEFRTDPACPGYKRCGGCQLQSMNYEAQLKFKQKRVEECLKRIGGCDELHMESIIASDMTLRYRNKAQYPVGTDKNGNPVCGFYAERTHDIIECEDCLLSPREFGIIVSQILKWMKQFNIKAYDERTGKGLIRHIFIRKGFTTKEILLCLVINGKKIPYTEVLRDRLESIQTDEFHINGLSISENTKRSNVIMGEKTEAVYGKPYIEDYIGDIKYRISPMSFYQINPGQTKKLYDKVLEYALLNGNETVVDLYCGTGTISLYMAKKAGKVIGIEIIPEAIEDAKVNAALNNIKNAEFYVGKAEEVLPELYDGGLKQADVVVVDPPRKGCDETALKTIVDINPAKLIYVSCNPATLARDIKYLKEKGYVLEKTAPLDMFPNTTHVESIALLSRREIDSK
jgi:23S rRNA (uracil1939-C5)-methyltransferase